VLAEFGGDKSRYADARARKDYAGTSPITRQSGKKKVVLARRARIVLLAAEGLWNTEIAVRVGVARQTVVSRRASYARRGLEGLRDAPRAGRPRRGSTTPRSSPRRRSRRRRGWA
jgi:transposase